MPNVEPRQPIVLVVDDDEMATKAVLQLLGRRGFTMLSAADGVQCIEKLEDGLIPDVIVLDVMMPEMDGLEVAQRLRADARFREIPIVLLTGCDDFETRAAGMKLGVSEFLCKPFAHHELIERINNQLEVRRIAAELDTVVDQL